MIKVRQEFNHITGEYYLGTKIICRTDKINRWYLNSRNDIFKMFWSNPSEPILGPTCLSAWSK